MMFLSDRSLMNSYPTNKVLVNEYDEHQHLYFLKSGALKLTRIDQEGNELMTYLLSKGNIFGITQLLTDEYSGHEKIEAVQNSVVCKVGMKVFKELMDRNKDLNNHVLKLSGLKIKRLETRLEEVLFKSAETRIRNFIPSFIKKYGKKDGSIFKAKLFLNNKDIASLTNSSRQKVIQVMNAMKKEGIIRYDAKHIQLLKQL